MPINCRRKLLRSVKDSKWDSTIPSAYSLASLGLDTTSTDLKTTADFKVASFYRYIEGQRLHRSLKGSRSLKDTAVEVLIRHLSELDNLNDIPKAVTKCVWDTLKRRYVAYGLEHVDERQPKCMMSFHSWKVLSMALHTEEDVTLGMLHYSKCIKPPDSALQIYIRPLISKTFDFITSLSIAFPCTVAELVQLAEISNLGILEIIHPDLCGTSPSGMGDIVLRAWSREADENGAFSVLRIFRLWNHKNLTEKSLQYMRSFPSLAVFDVRNCGIGDDEQMVLEAEKLGWVTVCGTNLFQVLEDKCKVKGKVSENFPSEHGQAEREFEKVLWLGSKVRRMARSNVQSFFAQSGPYFDHCPSNNNQLLDNGVKNPLSGTDAARWPDSEKDVAEGDGEWATLSWDIFCNTRNREAWESSYAACWTRIGELREDRDLILAGVRGIEQQTFVGPHLVSPIPVAYIRLGEVDQPGEIWEATSTQLVPKTLEAPISFQDGLVFLRPCVDPGPAPPQSAIDLQLEEASSGKRKVGGFGRMRSLKKQKLDEVLNGFQAPRED